MIRYLSPLLAGLLAWSGYVGDCRAGTIPVPNGSFESPTTPFVSVNVDAWQKAPKPDWYVDSGGFSWDYNIGLFKNTAPTSADHIDNCDGEQAVWLFAVPEVALFQDYDSVNWRSPEPSHAFNAAYEVGKSYQLTVAIVGGGGGMQPGASMVLSLYYRDANSNKVTVAATALTNSTAVFSNNTHFVDFTLAVPAVKPADAWAGKHIGIQMLSTVSAELQGGYWDLDNVRLSSTLQPLLLNPAWTNNQFQFTVQSEPGLVIEILSSSDLTVPVSHWSSVSTLTNSTGTTPFADPATSSAVRYYSVRHLP